MAQGTGSVLGKVLDNEAIGQPLSFASISLKNTLFSTQSNLHGNFEFGEVTPGHYTMQITFLGYEPIELPVVVEKDKTTYIKKGLNALTVPSPSLLLSEVSTDNGTTVEPVERSQEDN